MANSKAAPELDAQPSRGDLTSKRILDATVKLVALKGPHLTTVRDITAATGANVSAVSYYFGSKDGLVRQALATILNPVNTERRKLLRAARRRHPGGPVPGCEILHALVQPMVMAAKGSDGGRLYVRTVQQIRTFFGDALSMEIHNLNSRTVQLFLREMARTFPGLSRAELAWRHEFARGAALHMLANCDPLSRKMSQIIGANRFIETTDDGLVLLGIMQLTAPGFCQEGRPQVLVA